jgi:monofunctional glycosyltransferase
MLRFLGRCYIVVVLVGAAPTVAWAFGRSVALGVALIVFLAAQWVAIVVVVALRWIDPPTTAFMRRVARALPPEVQSVEFTWVPDAAISSEMRLAAIAGEDIYFTVHTGFDWESLRAAREHNRAEGTRARGGSTISQQVAKNLFLWPGRSYLRKAIETYFTLLLESVWNKRRILEVYLNVAQFGPFTFGAEAAAQRFFAEPALEVTRSEAALLVAVLPNPVDRNVDEPDRLVRYRQLLILASMKKLGPEHLARLGEPAAGAP